MVQGLEERARQEIADALNHWEPRVTLTDLVITRLSDRSVQVSCTFVYKATQDSFTTQSTFEL